MVDIDVAMAIFTARPEPRQGSRIRGDEGHHQHAPADAQQSGEEAGAGTEDEQFDHSVGGGNGIGEDSNGLATGFAPLGIT